MRLIDADALERLFAKYGNAWVIINDAPTIDAVEVVRCSECRFPYIKGMNAYCQYMVGPLHGKGYCSQGEPRT